MGNQHVKPEEKLKYINGEVSAFRESIRQQKKGTSKATQDAQYQYLVKFSKEVNSLKGRVKEKNLKRTQENISRTVTEVLSKPVQERESNLDSGAVETDSFVGVPMNKRHSSTRSITEIPTKKPKSCQVTMSKHVSTLQDIDMKFKSLKPQIKTAIDNKESTQLRFHKKTIEVLATDLEMIEIYDDTPVGDRKEKLVSALTSQYQKINSAMKEIQRNKDVDYLVNQRNNTLMRNLEEIRRELGKTDATLKEAVKNDAINMISTAKENLVKINQKLSSIEVNDENAKQIKMQMIDQITWLFKYIDESTKKGSQSDLTKAQVNYEDLIKGIARGKNKNKEDIQIKLESLQTFINTIEEKDESDAKKKKQLLNNINDSFSSLCEIGKNEPDVVHEDQKQTAPRIAVDILKDVNQFCKSMEKSMKQIKFSDSELNELVRSLENLMHTIKSTRRNISANRLKLSKKQNHSVPDLTKLHCIRDEFRSHSSPNTPEGMRKTGNYFDPNIPRVESIDDGSPELRNGMSSKRNDNCFSAVDQIRTQVNYIKEKINDIEDKSIVMSKLTTFRKTLQSYFNHSNQTIANNARLVSADIQDLSKNIYDIQELTQIYFHGKIETIHDSYEHMKKVVDEFFDKRGSDSYEIIKRQLLTCEESLSLNDKITEGQKDEMIRKLQTLSGIFEKKADITETLNSLKEKVKRFSGAYKGVLYNKIEKDINKIIIDISEHIENRGITDEIMIQAEKHLKILENRATRDQSFRKTNGGSPNLDDKKLVKMRKELENIRNEFETFSTNDVDSFTHLKSRLDLVTLELDQLKNLNENEQQMKIFIQNEIEALKIIVDAKISTAKEGRSLLILKGHDNNEDKVKNKIDTIEENLNLLKSEIEQFVGTTSDDKFYELEEHAIRLLLKINDMIDIAEGSELHKRKAQLLEETQKYSEMLNKRANETETLIHFERSIRDIENNFDHYVKSTEDLEKLADHIKIVQEDLERTNFNRNLGERKQSCVVQINNVVRRISTVVGEEEENKSFIGRTQEISSRKSAGISSEGKELQSVRAHGKTADTSAKKQEVSDQSILLRIIENEMSKTEKKSEGSSTSYQYLEKSTTERIYSRSSFRNEEQSGVVDKSIISKKVSEDTKDNYIGSTSFLEDVRKNGKKKLRKETDTSITTFDDIEDEIAKLTAEISTFDNKDTSEEYQQLEDNILKLNVRLNLQNIGKNDPLYERKLELEKKVSKCLDYLDKHMQALEMISGIDIELKKLERIMEKSTTEEENDILDEKLIQLQVKLGRIPLDDEPNRRKMQCTERIQRCMRNLGEGRKSRDHYKDTAV